MVVSQIVSHDDVCKKSIHGYSVEKKSWLWTGILLYCFYPVNGENVFSSNEKRLLSE